jgi:ABC-2 type transport system permease protein
MKKTIAVARWEYMEKIKSKAFLISLFLTPAIMIAVSVIPALLASQADTESKTIGVIDLSGQVVQPLADLLEQRFKLPNGQSNYILRSFPVDSQQSMNVPKHIADSLTVAEALEGYLIIGKDYLNDTSFDYRSCNVGNLKVTENLQRTLRDLIVSQKLKAEGIDPGMVKDLTRSLELKTIKVSKSGKEEESGFGQVFFTAYIFMMMMFILIMTSGQMLVRSMLEEKSNRVVEVLMSSCSANDLMAGKIIGLSGMGITQMLFWVLIGVAVSLKFSIPILPLPALLLILVYIILGYLLYAAIFVAAGSPVSTEQEAQQITSYLVMILIIPIVLAFSVAQNPNSTLIKVLSYVPLLSPSIMIMRIPNQFPPVLDILLTLFLLIGSVVGMMWIAGKIFRTTILSFGKRPSLRELIALIRAS